MKRPLAKLLLCCIAMLTLVSCAHLANPHADRHPLNGKVWDVAGRRFVDPAQMIERAAATRFVLLGEIHDNAEHHRIQTDILGAIVKNGRRPALVMEQYDVDQQEKLNAVVHGSGSQEDKLRGLAELMRTGWDWPLYRPLLQSALQQRLPLVAANLSRDALRQVVHNGYEVLGADEESRLALAAVWSQEKEQQLVQEVALGHCGKMPDHVVQSIVKAQRARDAVMADMLLLVRKTGGVAIIGRGHARQDLGVPLYLAARAPEEAALSVGLVEVEVRTDDPAAYAYGPLGQQYDYLWFTTRTQRKSDPCDSIPALPKTAG